MQLTVLGNLLVMGFVLNLIIRLFYLKLIIEYTYYKNTLFPLTNLTPLCINYLIYDYI